jgi:PAS domain S-box-containing protein
MNVRVLHLASDPRDADLVRERLAGEGIACELVHAGGAAAFEEALRGSEFQILLADFLGPAPDPYAALDLAATLRPGTPFIFLDVPVGEERAIEALRRGATDFVHKPGLERLSQAMGQASAEAARRQSAAAREERLRRQAALLDRARDAVVVLDLLGHIDFWNKAAEALYGWAPAEALGKDAFQLHLKYSPALRDARRRALEKGDWSGELENYRKDGHLVAVESRWSLVRGETGEPESVLVMDADISERRRLQSQLLRAQRMDSIGALAGGIAHDLNNVLAPILMAAEALKRSATDARSQKLLSAIEFSGRRAADMVRQVLTFARGVDGESTSLEARRLLEDVEKICEETFPRSIQIDRQVAPDLWPVSGNATQLHQVLLNLCVNARDAMPQGGTLTLRGENVTLDKQYVGMKPTARAGPHVLFTVADTGTGIPEALREKVFEPFFTTKGAGKGTGLGLATSLFIVRSHDGFMTLQSEDRKGATFCVYLPAASSVAMDRVTSPGAAPEGGGELILVVDDEAAIRELTKETLESHGYRVATAGDGAEAAGLFASERGKIAAVLTDMTMPFLDGPGTIRALRRIDPGVKILAMSGIATHEVRDDATLSSTQAFLQKPFTADYLLRTLHEVLAGPGPSRESE